MSITVILKKLEGSTGLGQFLAAPQKTSAADFPLLISDFQSMSKW
jgi:hypothetical protein